MEGRIEYGDVRYGREVLHRHTDAGNVHRVVQRRKNGQFLDIGDHVRGDDDRAGELVAAMHDAVADGGHVFRVESKCAAEQGRGFLHHLEQVGKLEWRVFGRFDLGADHDRDTGHLLVGVVDDAVHIGTAFSVS